MMESTANSEVKEYMVSCHCKRVSGKFVLSWNKNEIEAWECNCSDCGMRGNVHIIVPKNEFQITTQMSSNDRINNNTNNTIQNANNNESFEEATTLYEWGTKVAKRRFCKTCGILAWYIPRSNPDGIAITLNCIHWGEDEGVGSSKPNVKINKFDGIHWEESFKASKITNESSQNNNMN